MKRLLDSFDEYLAQKFPRIQLQTSKDSDSTTVGDKNAEDELKCSQFKNAFEKMNQSKNYANLKDYINDFQSYVNQGNSAEEYDKIQKQKIIDQEEENKKHLARIIELENELKIFKENGKDIFDSTINGSGSPNIITSKISKSQLDNEAAEANNILNSSKSNSIKLVIRDEMNLLTATHQEIQELFDNSENMNPAEISEKSEDDETQTHLKTYLAEIEKLKEKLQNAHKRIDELNIDLEDQFNSETEKFFELDELKKSFTDKENQFQDMMKKYDEKVAQLNEKFEDLKIMCSANKAMVKDISELQTQIKNVQNGKIFEQKRADEANTSKLKADDDLQNLHKQYNMELDIISKEIEAAKANAERDQEKLHKNYEEYIRKIDANNKTLEEEIKSLKRKNENLNQKYIDLNVELGTKNSQINKQLEAPPAFGQRCNLFHYNIKNNFLIFHDSVQLIPKSTYI